MSLPPGNCSAPFPATPVTPPTPALTAEVAAPVVVSTSPVAAPTPLFTVPVATPVAFPTGPRSSLRGAFLTGVGLLADVEASLGGPRTVRVSFCGAIGFFTAGVAAEVDAVAVPEGLDALEIGFFVPMGVRAGVADAADIGVFLTAVDPVVPTVVFFTGCGPFVVGVVLLVAVLDTGFLVPIGVLVAVAAAPGAFFPGVPVV